MWWKIKDGLLIGDGDALDDKLLYEDHKITREINCMATKKSRDQRSFYTEEMDLWRVESLNYPWADNEWELILDPVDEVADVVFNFIESALDSAETVIVLSVYGQSRSVCLVIAYMMRKFQWSLAKATEFINKRRPDNCMQDAFVQQLRNYERRLAERIPGPLSYTWDLPGCCSGDSEEVLLLNTFLNSFEQPFDEDLSSIAYDRKPQRLTWPDKMSGNKALLEIPDGIYIKHNVDKNGELVVRSVLKGSARSAALASSLASTAEGSVGLGLLSSTIGSSSRIAAPPTSTSTVVQQQPQHQPPPPANVPGPLRVTSPAGWHEEKGAKVFRFLIAFEPPALAVEWGQVRTGERKCTRIEFEPEDFIQSSVRLLAERVLASSPVLTVWHKRTVESLLSRLANRSLPLYRIPASTGVALLRYQPFVDAEVVVQLPSNALVLSCERVRRPDGWWLRVSSGHWLQEMHAEACAGADADAARRWLRDATESRVEALFQNAYAVVLAINNCDVNDLS